MTEDMLRAVIDAAQAKQDKAGWLAMPEGRVLTLYAAHDGVALTVNKIERLRIAGPLLHAQNSKGETFLVAAADVFAAATDAPDAGGGRRTGFLG